MKYAVPFLLQWIGQKKDLCEKSIETPAQHSALEAVDPMSFIAIKHEADMWADLYDIVQRLNQSI